jgi:hypothetical protein
MLQAGIRDARFQEMMADVLLFLGINRIDWLLSMSGDKYDAIVSAGIEVMQRVPLPNLYVPKGATVEITVCVTRNCLIVMRHMCELPPAAPPPTCLESSSGEDRFGLPH